MPCWLWRAGMLELRSRPPEHLPVRPVRPRPTPSPVCGDQAAVRWRGMVQARPFIVHRRSTGRSGCDRGSVPVAVFQDAQSAHLPAPHHCRRHQHLEHEVVLVRRGTYRCRVNEHDLRLTPGQVLVVAPGDWHEDFFTPPLVLDTMHFRLEASPVRTRLRVVRPGTDPQRQVIPHPHPRLVSALRELQRPALDHRVQDALIAEVLWRMVAALPPAAVAEEVREDRPEVRFRWRLNAAIDANLHCTSTVADLAAALDMKPSTLASRCRRFLGRPPAQALMAARIERAQALLRFSAMSVAEVADHLGFADPFHFSKAFKRLVGAPPSRWRGTSRSG